MNWLLVFVGGGFGAMARYGISKLILAFFSTSFPLATLLSNLLACLVLGFLLWYSQGKQLSWIQPLFIIGFCGGFSTFSTFSQESFLLLNQANYGYFALNILLSLLFGIIILFFWQRISV